MDVRKPGYETTKQLWSPDPKYLQKFVDKHIIPFLDIKKNNSYVDMGERNPRIEYIENRLGIKVDTIDSKDFNFATLNDVKFDVVFALEIVEHLQNPLWFMYQLKNITTVSIYVLIPCNPKWLWHEMHFFEMKRKHFEKWILKPIGLKIVRYKKIHFIANWKVYLIGLRPLIRVLTGKTTFKDFLRSFFYIQYAIYEIRSN
ncbi:MAG: hypothetical protein OEY89_01380 [Gammaproteobacteria bacterium]|nr:hypothetical protein [Gammaproteobacteria bacterium]